MLSFVFLLAYCGKPTTPSLSGKLIIIGNEPFTNLALDTDNGKIYIISKESTNYTDLWNHQGKNAKLIIDQVAGDTIIVIKAFFQRRSK